MLFKAIDVRPSKPWVGGSNPSWITIKNNAKAFIFKGFSVFRFFARMEDITYNHQFFTAFCTRVAPTLLPC